MDGIRLWKTRRTLISDRGLPSSVMDGIVATADVMGGEPRLEGRRISVRQIAELVIDGAEAPVDVADQLDVPVADVHLALAYYYDHPDEMEAIREQHRERVSEVEERSVDPPEALRR